MTQGAHVGSFAAVREFRAALVTFLHEARDALGSHDIEVRRSLEWLLDAQPKFWQQELRRRDQALTEAKIELERCRSSSLPGGGTPSCMEEKKALERARLRCQQARDKIDAVRRWSHAFEREAAEYSGRATQLSTALDADLPAAIAMLDRVLTSLEAYAALESPTALAPPPRQPVALEPEAAAEPPVPQPSPAESIDDSDQAREAQP